MTFIIAEIGVNHQGDVNLARSLIDSARGAGADCAKFQLFKSQKLWGDGRIADLELRFSDMEKLYRHCQDTGIEFACTPFGIDELHFLTPFLKRIKIASGCLRNFDLLYVAHQTGFPVILSTGISTIEEIEQALGMLAANVTLLHCTSSYPAPVAEVNLRVMDTLHRHFGLPVGYSDHTRGITVSIAAAAKGATVIEKHLTFDTRAKGPDHKASIESLEFTQMVEAIRLIESALGDGVKRIMPSEEGTRRTWFHTAS